MLQVFVYGTLMRGESNHSWLAGAEYLGDSCTEPCYELVDLGGYPAMLPTGRTAVAGEIFRVDAPMLKRLDVLEEVPEYYRREVIHVARMPVQVYLLSAEQAENSRRIASGDWRRR